MTDPLPIKLSAMHHQHMLSGATMVEVDGWRQPARYTSVDQEVELVRTGGGLCDISPTGKISLQGSELGGLLIGALNAANLPVSGVVKQVGPSDQPRFVAGLAHDEYLILTGPEQRAHTIQGLEEFINGCAHLVDVTSALAGVRIVGPMGRLLLASVTDLNVNPDSLVNMSCAQTSVAEVHGILLRLDLGSIPGYEVYFPREFGEYIWSILVELGDPLGIKPVGIKAMASIS